MLQANQAKCLRLRIRKREIVRRKRLSVSLENVEKVVNPPQIPVAKHSPIGIHQSSVENANIIPIMRHPMMFTNKVPKGKVCKIYSEQIEKQGISMH